MPQIDFKSLMDRLYRLVDCKPTAQEFEDSGGRFNRHLHFIALLPSPGLPQHEAEKAEKYFETMLKVLEPVQSEIQAYWLTGVMTKKPVSDFSLEIQFRDWQTAPQIWKALPKPDVLR